MICVKLLSKAVCCRNVCMWERVKHCSVLENLQCLYMDLFKLFTSWHHLSRYQKSSVGVRPVVCARLTLSHLQAYFDASSADIF